MTLQLIPSEFPYRYEENLVFFFIRVLLAIYVLLVDSYVFPIFIADYKEMLQYFYNGLEAKIYPLGMHFVTKESGQNYLHFNCISDNKIHDWIF